MGVDYRLSKGFTPDWCLALASGASKSLHLDPTVGKTGDNCGSKLFPEPRSRFLPFAQRIVQQALITFKIVRGHEAIYQI